MTDTTAQHIAARDDADLRARLVATAEQLGVDEPEAFVRQKLGKLVSTPIDGQSTITSVHAYASTQYAAAVAALPPKPGVDPAMVTDAQLAQAVEAVWNPA